MLVGPIHLSLTSFLCGLFKRHRLTSSFAAGAVIAATRGHYITKNVNTGLNKLLSKSTVMFFSDEDSLLAKKSVLDTLHDDISGCSLHV